MEKGQAGRGAGRKGSRRAEAGAGRARRADETAPSDSSPSPDRLESPAARRLAHDLKNQLAIILGSAELAATRVGDDEKLGAHLEQILRATERALAIVHDVLEGREGPRQP